MKTLFVILVCAIAASAQQQYIPCLADTAPPGLNDTMTIYGGYKVAVHTPIWGPKPADTAHYKIGYSNYMALAVYMPVAGTCSGSFEAYDDRNEASVIAMDALGNYIKTPIRVAGDIEIVIVDENGFAAFARRRQYVAYHTTGRAAAGDFDVRLPAGYYRIIINNTYSNGSKSVKLTLGRGDAPPETPITFAPTFAPFKPITRTNQTNSNTNDAPPKLQKRPKTNP